MNSQERYNEHHFKLVDSITKANKYEMVGFLLEIDGKKKGGLWTIGTKGILFIPLVSDFEQAFVRSLTV